MRYKAKHALIRKFVPFDKLLCAAIRSQSSGKNSETSFSILNIKTTTIVKVHQTLTKYVLWRFQWYFRHHISTDGWFSKSLDKKKCDFGDKLQSWYQIDKFRHSLQNSSTFGEQTILMITLFEEISKGCDWFMTKLLFLPILLSQSSTLQRLQILEHSLRSYVKQNRLFGLDFLHSA